MKLISSERALRRVILSREGGEGFRVRTLARSRANGDQRHRCEILHFAQDDRSRGWPINQLF